MMLEHYFSHYEASNLHRIGDFAFHGIWRQRCLGVCIVDLVAVGGKNAAGVHVR